MDEHFMKMRGFPLTWFDYFAWSKGPVAPEVYDIKNGAFNEFVTYSDAENNKRIVSLVPDISEALTKYFSKTETNEINILIALYKNSTADELSNITHLDNSLWSKVVHNNKLKFNEYIKTSNHQIYLEDLFTNDDWRYIKYQDARWTMNLQAKIELLNKPDNKIQLRVLLPSEREEYRISVYAPAIP